MIIVIITTWQCNRATSHLGGRRSYRYTIRLHSTAFRTHIIRNTYLTHTVIIKNCVRRLLVRMVYLPALFGREQEQKRHNTRQNTNCRLSGRVVLAAVARARARVWYLLPCIVLGFPGGGGEKKKWIITNT